ncbi:hypothetical protein IAT38_004877 [Cryptococcus sp. DSM 104549]
MTTALLPTTHAPSIRAMTSDLNRYTGYPLELTSSHPHPPHPHAHVQSHSPHSVAHSSGTPSRPDLLAYRSQSSSHSPSPYPPPPSHHQQHQLSQEQLARAQEHYRSPQEDYIPTPDSVASFEQQQQAQPRPQVYQQPAQPHVLVPGFPGQGGYLSSSQEHAGPSTQRRTSVSASTAVSNGNGHGSGTGGGTMSIGEYYDSVGAGAGESSNGAGRHVRDGRDGKGGGKSASGVGQRERERGERMQVDEVEDDGRIGVGDPRGERSYTEMKCLGDGSFGTVWLCDWHSPVKPDVLLSAMQCGAGARPEWAGKRLVALKRMKRVWEGGWTQARMLGELVSLRKIPPHPAIIPLYDAFISPKSRELYFVFECMEGNLYQLTKSRRGRPLAAGLIASCFHQISTGLYHIHRHGYFHRDMKPENLLVTTTGLADYLTAGALAQINRGAGAGELKMEKDVSVIVKLADFGLARATDSKPPYTEYVSTRWYRAPEVLLRSSEYGPPVDMWALGTILAEMLNLKPLFPGVSEIDQVYRICDTMGDPSADYGTDERGMVVGGGQWNSGIKLAKNVGFSFPKRKPVRFRGLFNENVPQSLVDCISDLLRYNPKYRMTSAQCIDHPYFHETLPHLKRTPPLPRIPFSAGQPQPGSAPSATPPARAPAPVPPEAEIHSAAPRQLPPSHAHTPHDAHRPAFANGDIRTLPPPVGTPDGTQGRMYYGHMHPQASNSASALVNQLRELDLPTDDLASYGGRPPLSPGSSRAQAQAQAQAQEQAHAHAHNQAHLHHWVNDLAINPTTTSRRPSVAPSTLYDGSVFEGSQDALSLSNPSFTNFSTTSIEMPGHSHAGHSAHGGHVGPGGQGGQGSYGRSSANVAAYVQQQSRYTEVPRVPQIPSQPAPAPPQQQAPEPARADKLGVTGKKKKWGLSSVFGGADKPSSEQPPLPTVDEHGYSGSSLKRTQSGNRTADRQLAPPGSSANLGMSSMSMGMSSVSLSGDPKKAKKEAERQAKELAKAQREAAAQKQKERARAVMQKRNQLVEARGKSKTEMEYTSTNLVVEPEAPPLNASMLQPSIHASASTMKLGHHPTPQQPQQQQVRDMKAYASSQASQSLQSVRSHDSGHSGHSGRSGRSGLSHQALEAFDASHEEGLEENRHKARRRAHDDDHSMSSFGQHSLRSRSVLTVGTVDSDPGPRRSTREHWPDPLHRHDKRAPSASSSSLPFQSHPLSGMSRSNASLESQLAHDFHARANVGAGASSSSLGRHSHASASHPSLGMHGGSGVAASQRSLPPMPELYGASGMALGEGNGSVPTSPYGRPTGAAVALGAGIARHGHGHGHGHGAGTMLPSISDWEGQGQGQINPMFRVPPAGPQQQQQQQQTLPPFSQIANYAAEGAAQGHQRPPQQ